MFILGTFHIKISTNLYFSVKIIHKCIIKYDNITLFKYYIISKNKYIFIYPYLMAHRPVQYNVQTTVSGSILNF